MSDTANFFDNLYETLDHENNEDNTCLITGETLLKDCIKLPCSHVFNYIPLFNEIKKQKRSFFPNSKNLNYFESAKLSKYQIKCPYCRQIFNGLLPQSNNSDSKEQCPISIYVNFPTDKCILLNNCSYIFISGKKKNTACSKGCKDKLCNFHIQIEAKQKNVKVPSLCNYTLKRGPRKGCCCGKKTLLYTIAPTQQYCKAHEKWSSNYGNLNHQNTIVNKIIFPQVTI
ncbi:MAG: hypothetical protein CXT73_06610 [Methanobacteriota archaeon]|nr:MAG: hypothetical protein CXT73_06610 [Euryarchaeota archaeon]